ncbi:MAG: NAD(P)-dependent oxidoreductase [Gemmobacter sp.]
MIHTADPAPHVAMLRGRVPAATFAGCDSYAALPALVADLAPDAVFTIRFAGSPGFPAAALTGPGGPRWIAVGGSGVDHLGAWDAARTVVTNAAGLAADQMAEFVIGAALHFRLDLPGLAADKAARHWRRERVMTPLRGGICLIVGLGRTGMAVAARARAMGMRVVGVRANPAPAPGMAVHGTAALPDLWPAADLIAVCTPLTAATRGLIGAAALAAMKRDAILVDVSRGGVVDDMALAAALAAGHLAGAALDVFEVEPLPKDHPLWSAPRTIICPHASSVYDAWEGEAVAFFADNLERFIAGEPLVNVVDPARGY